LSYILPFRNNEQLTFWKKQNVVKTKSFEINRIYLRRWKDRTIGYKLDRVHFCRISDGLEMSSN